MHKNGILIWLCLAFCLFNSLPTRSATAQQNQASDPDKFAIQKEINPDTSFSEVNKTNEIGLDSPVAQDGSEEDSNSSSDSEEYSDSSSDSEEYSDSSSDSQEYSDSYSDNEEVLFKNESSRRKRDVADHMSIPNGNLERKKRSPFYTAKPQGYGGKSKSKHGRRRRSVAAKVLEMTRNTKGYGGKSKSKHGRRRRSVAAKVLEETRNNKGYGGKSKSKHGRRRRSVAAKVLEMTRNTKGYGKKSKSKCGRRRRQAEFEKFNNDVENAGKNIGEYVDKAMQKANVFWQSILQTSQQFADTMKQTFNTAPNGPSGGVNSNI